MRITGIVGHSLRRVCARRTLLRWVQIALKPAFKTLGLHGVVIRCKGLKYVIADSAFKRMQVDARACWLDTDKHRGVSLRFWVSQERQGVVSWFEFIDFRCDIVVGSLFGGHQFLGKAAPKITLRCFHQPGHQIFRHSVDRSILIDFRVD